ncbi:MAG: DUF3127 domain-containing protein [Bacteroidaceae bacterium]|nr:DUF3127 domain-containing protein [Bacteroidaceae bacterium]
MELAGRVIAVLEARSGLAKTTGNPWMTQEYVIETHEQFPRRMVFNVFGEEKIKQLNIQLGEEINVFFDINAREYQGRWYNDIRAWRVDRVTPGEVPAPSVMPGAQAFAGQPAGTAPAPIASAPAQPAATQAPVDFTEGDNPDDLPF